MPTKRGSSQAGDAKAGGEAAAVQTSAKPNAFEVRLKKFEADVKAVKAKLHEHGIRFS